MVEARGRIVAPGPGEKPGEIDRGRPGEVAELRDQTRDPRRRGRGQPGGQILGQHGVLVGGDDLDVRDAPPGGGRVHGLEHLQPGGVGGRPRRRRPLGARDGAVLAEKKHPLPPDQHLGIGRMAEQGQHGLGIEGDEGVLQGVALGHVEFRGAGEGFQR